MSDEPNRTSSRTTVSLPAEINDEATDIVEQTGVSLSDLCRQGMIRILLERRETGSVRLMQLPPRDVAA